jgi:shikimate dehydrogenase
VPKDSYLVGLIGSGIGPSLSPALHEREGDRQGLRLLYRLIDIDPLGVPPEAVGDLVRAARDLGYDGLNITHPCKQLVIEHLDALAPQAEALGAVNTVVFEDGRAVGHNTDVTGFAASFARGLPDASCNWAPAARARPSRTPCSPSAPSGSPSSTPCPTGPPPWPAP